MKGILFNHLESFANSTLSPRAWIELCEGLPLQTKERFVANQTYPDADLYTLVEGIAQKANLSIPDVYKAFGKLSISQLMEKHSEIISTYKTAKDLLKDLNFMHFTKVRDLYTETELPYFMPQTVDSDYFLLRYVSKRKMCFYLEGAIEGAAAFFNEKLSYTQTQCTQTGAKFCEFRISE
jgi:predicted hydrocarbon binding protein